MTKQELKEIERLQNKACGLLNTLVDQGLGEYEAMVYTDKILFSLNPEVAKETLTAFITQFERMI